HEDHFDDAEFVPQEDTPVLAPVGAAAQQKQEGSLGSVQTPSLVTGQVLMKPDAKPSPYPTRAQTPPVPPEQGDERPRLPRREPQANLVAQLDNEPDDDVQNDLAPGE